MKYKKKSIKNIQGVSKKSLVLKFKFLTATRQMAIILAFVALREIRIEQMATV